LKQAMSAKSETEGALAALQIENSKLQQQVQEMQSQFRMSQGSADDTVTTLRRQIATLQLQLETVSCSSGYPLPV
jgi:predicted RNase H-like nuclease (RuvC/YqgF family)